MAESNSGQERTEQPTARRRSTAHQEGKVPRSQELATATVLLAGTAALAFSGGVALTDFATQQLRVSASSLSMSPIGAAGAVTMIHSTASGLMLALVPFTATLVAAVLCVNLAQARGVLTLKPLAPQWSHLNPIAGFKRLAGIESVVNLIKSLLKVTVLGAVAWMVFVRAWPQMLSLGDVGNAAIALVTRDLVLRLSWITGLVFLVIAAADWFYQRHRFEKTLKMTRDEVRQEHKDTEGSPMVKARIQAMARALARKRMMQQVPKADVIIVNPTRIAIALRYDPLVAEAPIVVAMGERKLAQRIRELATLHGVPIVENRPVARALLATATVGKPIPPAMYVAVAEILAFVYRLKTQRGPQPVRAAGGGDA